MARKQGLIGITSTNTSPWVAPTRSSATIFGTNPICVSAPGAKEGDSFLLDMSTSAVALGKIEIQLRKNEPLPSLGWALGKDGLPTQDSKEAFYEGKGKSVNPSCECPFFIGLLLIRFIVENSDFSF